MVLSKTVELQGAANVPSVEDPMWNKTGPLGGVQYMIELLQKHTRVGGLQHDRSSGWVAVGGWGNTSMPMDG